MCLSENGGLRPNCGRLMEEIDEHDDERVVFVWPSRFFANLVGDNTAAEHILWRLHMNMLIHVVT